MSPFRYRLSPSPYDSQAKLARLVGHDQQVLELGCSTGYFSELLVRQGCQVVGLEIDAEAAQLARRWCSQVVVADLNTLPSLPALRGPFDVLLACDVLEHLVEPGQVLRWWVPYVKPDGRVIVSVPNVANWDIRWQLLRGRWRYQDEGVLDRTHLRFYTRQTLRELLREAGLRIVHEDVTPGPQCLALYRSTVHRVLRRLGLHERVADRLARLWPELWALQFLVVAARNSGAPPDSG